MSNLNIKELRDLKERLEALANEISTIFKGADWDIEDEWHLNALESASREANGSAEFIDNVISDLTTEPTVALIDTWKPEGDHSGPFLECGCNWSGYDSEAHGNERGTCCPECGNDLYEPKEDQS